jgi:hypothetical protein
MTAAVPTTAAAMAASGPGEEAGDAAPSLAEDADAALSWKVGRVRITRIVEMDLPAPTEFLQGATHAALRMMP